MTVIRGDVSWGFQAVRSSHCVNGDCLVASVGPGRCVMVWNSTNPLVVQVWEPGDWEDLLRAIKEYRQDTCAWVSMSEVVVTLRPTGLDEPVLEFTYAEWEAFSDGVEDGEFDYDKLSSPASRAGNSDAGRTAATGAVEPGVVPAPVVADMNAAGYAAMSVPAGRDLESNPMPVVAVDAVATTGQPGSDLLDEILDRLWSVERMALLAYRAAKGMERVAGPPDVPAGDVDELLRKAAEPLVRFDLPDTSVAAVDDGWAPDPGVNEAGEVGPGPAEHPSSGPTEPADCEQARA